MTRAKYIHWYPPGVAFPAARCGVYIVTAPLTRKLADVTCPNCHRFANPDAAPKRTRKRKRKKTTR